MSTSLQELSSEEQRLLAVTGVLLHQMAATNLRSPEMQHLLAYITMNQPLMRLLTAEEANRDIVLQAIFGVAVAVDPSYEPHPDGTEWSIGIASEAGRALALLQASDSAGAMRSLRAIGAMAVTAHSQCCATRSTP